MEQHISAFANHIRSLKPTKDKPLAITTTLFTSVLTNFETIEEQSSSAILVRQNSNARNQFLLDINFLYQHINAIKSLKLFEDNHQDTTLNDISKLQNLIAIEFWKVNVKKVKGLQILRSQIQRLVCHQTLNTLSDVLSECGADESIDNCWNELKELIFTKNRVVELDVSLECVPWLQTLDLSHNQLKSIVALDCLPNLKYLNLAFNKLEAAPGFQGQICNRLQNLVLKNNFIEDISGLQSLINLNILDLSNNCLVDSKSLLSLSHLSTLQWLNLSNNPLSFHPHHRSKTASCLHFNTISANFILNYAPLSYNEKKLIGTLFSTQSKHQSSLTASINPSLDKISKIREVIIEEAENTPILATNSIVVRPEQHLTAKSRIESLRKEHGDKWLLEHESGSVLQDVFGMEGTLRPPSTPVSSSPYEGDFSKHSDIRHQPDTIVPTGKAIEEEEADESQGKLDETESSFQTAVSETLNAEENCTESDTESDMDADLDGEENMYLATPNNESEEIFVIITKHHLREQECSTGDERVRWHINSVIRCEVVEGNVQIDFETIRKNRKQRIYDLGEDTERFVAAIRKIMEARAPRNDKIKFICMKCDGKFVKERMEARVGGPAAKCPTCDSTLVVEDV